MELIKNNEEHSHAIRKATVDDEKQIYGLLEPYAKEGVVLPRSETEIFEGLRDFTIYQSLSDGKEGAILGVAAVHIWQKDLVEIRSLVVKEGHKRQGIGTALVAACVGEARELGAKYIFALTYGVEFFKKVGFTVIHKDTLPEKIWGDCFNCAKFSDCDETAVIMTIKV